MRQNEVLKHAWSQVNQENSKVGPIQTAIAFMSLILTSAYEMDTLNTVIQMCKHVVNALWQKYVVLTVDEAFFCKLMELKWANQQYTEFFILHLGCLHSTMDFLKANDQLLQPTGLQEVWTD